MNAKGPDFSHWNGRVKWIRTKAMGADFAFGKCTDGINFYDPEYLANYAGALEQGTGATRERAPEQPGGRYDTGSIARHARDRAAADTGHAPGRGPGGP